MQEWEERELERIDARKEGEKLGEERGLELGKQRGLVLGEAEQTAKSGAEKTGQKPVPGEDR